MKDLTGYVDITNFNCQCAESNQPCLFKGISRDDEVVCCLFPKISSFYCKAECEVLGSNWGNWWGTLVFPTQGGVQDHGGPWWGPGQTGSEVPSHLLITTSSLCTKFEQFLMVINTVSPPTAVPILPALGGTLGPRSGPIPGSWPDIRTRVSGVSACSNEVSAPPGFPPDQNSNSSSKKNRNCVVLIERCCQGRRLVITLEHQNTLWARKSRTPEGWKQIVRNAPK